MHPTLLSASTPTRELETPQRNVKEATTGGVLCKEPELQPPPHLLQQPLGRFYLLHPLPSAPPIECRLAAGLVHVCATAQGL